MNSNVRLYGMINHPTVASSTIDVDRKVEFLGRGLSLSRLLTTTDGMTMTRRLIASIRTEMIYHTENKYMHPG
jgi:hypothetical protein